MEVYRSEPERNRTGARIKVGIADYAVGGPDSVIVTSGLGSCIGIALYDAEAQRAGLAHAMLPTADGDPDEAKFVDTAVGALVDAMCEAGATTDQMVAKLAGGSTMFEFTTDDGSIGDRNVAAANAALDRYDIDVVATDVGGSHGRSLELDGASGDLRVRSAKDGVSTL